VKSLPVVVLEPVRDDVQAAHDYFELRVARTGDRFLERYFGVVERIGLNPETFPVKFEDYRRALVPRSHLAVYYFVEPTRAVIAAVVDARRHPRRIRSLVQGRKRPAL